MNVLEEHWVCLHRDDGSSLSRPNRLCWPFRLYGLITEKTTILNLNIMCAGPSGPRGLRHRSTAAGLLRLWVRIPPGDVSALGVLCVVR